MEHMQRLCLLYLPAMVLFALLPAATKAGAAEFFVYFGTYTRGASKGIYVSRLDTSSGKLSEPVLVAETANPSFLAIHPNRRFLYAVSEGPVKGGGVSAFAINPKTGGLTFLNKVGSEGSGPCHVTVDKTGKFVLVANYGSGSAAVLPIAADGKLEPASSSVQHKGSSVNPQRQAGPHAHSVNVSPDNRFAFIADLGLDQVLVYKLDTSKGTITPNTPPFATIAPGSGPRHLAFHPSAKFAYVINEMGNTVTAFNYDASKGVLKELETVTTLPKGYAGTSYTAEVQVHPSGKFLYGSNRGHDSIAVFSIDQKKGTLKLIELVPTQGNFPRNFGIDPTGTILIAANEKGNNAVVYRIDAKTGKLTPTGQVIEMGSPVCVKFL